MSSPFDVGSSNVGWTFDVRLLPVSAFQYFAFSVPTVFLCVLRVSAVKLALVANPWLAGVLPFNVGLEVPMLNVRPIALAFSLPPYHIYPTMGMMKNYLLNLLQQCSEEQFGQEAVEWAIVSGFVRTTYDLDSDVHEIMSRYDEIIERYRRSLAQAAQPAPMQRAAPGRRAKASAAKPSARKKHAA